MPNGQWPVLYNQVSGCNREALWLTALLRPRDERGVRMTCSTIVWGMLWGMDEHANVQCGPILTVASLRPLRVFCLHVSSHVEFTS